MGIGELLHSACHSNAIKLTNTGRPYFLRSVYLVNQCRALQLYCKERKFPEKDLAGLLTRIGDVLQKAGEENVRLALNPNVDDMFVKVEADIEAFLTRHSAPQPQTPPIVRGFSIAMKEDSTMALHLRKVIKDNEKKLVILKAFKTMKFKMSLWPAAIRKGQGWNSYMMDFIIEKDATLDVCLLRVLECKLKLPKGAIMFSMRQNPQLYGGFAYEQQRFEEIARRQRDKIHVEETEGPDIVIYPLHLWRSVEKEVEQADGLLHMLVDRANSAGEEYSNNWTLEDGRIVARRALSGSLLLLSAPQPSVPSPSRGSAQTLVPPAGASTSSLPGRDKKKRNFEHTSNAYSGMEMQTVEAESQERGGFGGWMKNILRKYI